MRSDGGMLRYLLNRNAPAGSGARRDLAFGFDGVNDYISSNATIGRTGYDMNVSGNVSTGSDGDGSYIWINGNRDDGALTGTRAELIGGSTPAFTQATSFTISSKFKAPSLPTGVTGIFGSNQDACIDINATQIRFTIRGSSTVTNSYSLSANTIYTCHLVYDTSVAKFYAYINGTLQNVGGTAGPATFTTDTRRLGDNAIGGGTQISSNKYIYHSAVRNKALTQAEIDADIALGNTTKQDPSIVAYYVPENLQYNTQYLSSPKDLSVAGWSKGTGTSVVADFSVAPDGTTTADQVTRTGIDTTTSKTMQSVSGLTAAQVASKVIIVKAFVKVAAATAPFRLWISHSTVADYRSSNLTATTTRQEFTFTQTLTSSTAGGIVCGLCCDSTNAAAILEVWNVRTFITNETLRDESPNIGGFIGRKTQKVFSCRYKPNADFADAPDAGALMVCPRSYMHDRSSTHQLQIRYDNRFGARTSIATLGASYRTKVHALGLIYFESGVFKTKIYVNGSLVDSDVRTVDPAITNYNTVMRSGKKGSTYFSGNIRDARIYTFTGSFTDADALAIYNGGEPTGAGVTKYLQYKPPVGELGTTTQDQSTNNRDGTLNGGVTRDYI